ncbi:MAG: hypothetical protein LBE62_03785 [Azonexus sp.]|nr:hypothetical protein [Azonexus sp.]
MKISAALLLGGRAESGQRQDGATATVSADKTAGGAAAKPGQQGAGLLWHGVLSCACWSWSCVAAGIGPSAASWQGISTTGCDKDITALCAKPGATASNRQAAVNKAIVFRHERNMVRGLSLISSYLLTNFSVIDSAMGE